MPASKETPNFKLPVYGPLDTASYLVTFNGLTNALDGILQQLKTAGVGNASEIDTLMMEMDEVKEQIAQNAAGVKDWMDWKQLNSGNLLYNQVAPEDTGVLTDANGVSRTLYACLSNDHVAVRFTRAAINYANSTKTVIGNFNYIDILSFPGIIRKLPASAVSIETAVQINSVFASIRKLGGGVDDIFFCDILAYRLNNLTRIILKIDNNAVENIYAIYLNGAFVGGV